ncbi:hypothetical protein K443DRAFT_131894 [Laccaria amethystina LaAM-08-1]|uniref:Copper acquisition factor BIM1-like domain-containing protein n=1 Tax=Laccaria amethystina LaAM-08-1 TaxID=1095629 RepID=A0A0C9WTF0_9AGAR|nr:hypothetical protein K443DRAFT_131894 [Laccaria amethystina LaAM-08-1]
MSFLSLTILLCFASVARAHFRLLFPEPRGVFVADQEPNYCGGYTNAVPNRTVYPLSGGFFSIKSGHPSWTVQNPTSFDNFSSNGVQQFVSPYAKEASAGTFCMPLNISASNATGVKDGANVTIQVVWSGGDGNLYQCADLTLSSNATVGNATCVNETVATSSTSAVPTASHTAVAGLALATS